MTTETTTTTTTYADRLRTDFGGTPVGEYRGFEIYSAPDAQKPGYRWWCVNEAEDDYYDFNSSEARLHEDIDRFWHLQTPEGQAEVAAAKAAAKQAELDAQKARRRALKTGLAEAQAFMDSLPRRPWKAELNSDQSLASHLCEWFGVPGCDVVYRQQRDFGTCHHKTGVITLRRSWCAVNTGSPWARKALVIHEVAHWIHSKKKWSGSSHGKTFRAIEDHILASYGMRVESFRRGSDVYIDSLREIKTGRVYYTHTN